MTVKNIPSSVDIDRLLSLQHTDPGFFILAIYAFIEGYLRNRYEQTYDQALFSDLVSRVRAELMDTGYLSSRDFQCLNTLTQGAVLANQVRHSYSQVSGEELIAAVFRLKQFARLNDFYSGSKLMQLDETLGPWETRKTNSALSRELQEASKKISQLTSSNTGLATEVAALGVLKNQLLHLESVNSSMNVELDNLKKNTKDKDEKYDLLRKNKFSEQETVRKEMLALQVKIAEMADARMYLEALSRITVYTKTRLDFEQNLIRLSPEQNKIIDQIKLKKDFLVKGSAGTGKSLVLVKAMEKALGTGRDTLGLEATETVALLTYTKSLVAYTGYMSKLLDMPIPPHSIATVDSFLRHRFKSLVPEGEIVFNSETLHSFFETPAGDKITAKELFNEAENFIWANMITEDEYVGQAIQRTGMKKMPAGTQRKTVWDAVAKAGLRLQEENTWTSALSALHIVNNAETLNEDEKVDYIFIDEVQDLSAVRIAAVKKCSRRAVILAGDADQSIYQNGFSWKRAGIDIGGRTRILHTNFRNTIQLHEFAEKYRKTISGMDSENTSEAFRFGVAPECSKGKTITDLYELVLQKTNLCLKYLSYDPENICIIAPKRDHLLHLADELKNRFDIPSAIINQDNFDFEKKGVIRLSTMHSSKGLDFPVTLFLPDHRLHFQSTYDEETQDRLMRNLIYVSITRALEQLHVFTLEGATAEAITELVG